MRRVAPLEDIRKTAERLYINRMNAPIEGFAMPAFSEMSTAEGKDEVDNGKQPEPQRDMRQGMRGRGYGPQRGRPQRWMAPPRQNFGTWGNQGYGGYQRQYGGTFRPQGQMKDQQADGCWQCGNPEHNRRDCPDMMAQQGYRPRRVSESNSGGQAEKTDPDGQVPVKKLEAKSNRNF